MPDIRAGLAFRRDPLAFLRAADDGGDLIRFRAGLTDFTVIKNPETIRRVLVTEASLFGEGKWTLRGERVMRDCLITREGDPHRDRRGLLQPGFDRGRLAAKGRAIVARADRLGDAWADGESIDARAEMGRLALTATGEALFSLELEPEADILLPALTRMLGEIPRPGLPWPGGRGLASARKTVGHTVARAVADRRESPSSDGDVVSLLLAGRENGDSAVSDTEIADEIVSLLIASVDTTPGTLAWTWALLARHPEVEARVHRELDDVLGERSATVDDISRLDYLQLVLNEVLRLYPPVHFIDRRPFEDIELDGDLIAAGSFLLISPLLTHRDPRFYAEPQEFRPERWAPEARAKRPRFAYLPFGGGPHTCIGMHLARIELSLVIGTLARRWRLHPAPDFGSDASPQRSSFPMMLARR